MKGPLTKYIIAFQSPVLSEPISLCYFAGLQNLRRRLFAGLYSILILERVPECPGHRENGPGLPTPTPTPRVRFFVDAARVRSCQSSRGS